MTELMNHYTKLNDENRNKTFWNALCGCNLKGKRVLVIGDEILDLFSAKAGADKVYICNDNKMTDILLKKKLKFF